MKAERMKKQKLHESLVEKKGLTKGSNTSPKSDKYKSDSSDFTSTLSGSSNEVARKPDQQVLYPLCSKQCS
jgi:hypothetical protein